MGVLQAATGFATLRKVENCSTFSAAFFAIFRCVALQAAEKMPRVTGLMSCDILMFGVSGIEKNHKSSCPY